MKIKFRPIKICKNPDCKQDVVHYKSSKREYCDDACKNRANYLKKISKESELIETDKAMRKNYKILILLRNLILGPVQEQTLISHGFNFDAMHKDVFTKDKHGKPIQANRIYDIYFVLNDEKQLIII